MQTRKSKVVLLAATEAHRPVSLFKPRVRQQGEALPQTRAINPGLYDGKELVGGSRAGSMDAYAIPSKGIGA